MNEPLPPLDPSHAAEMSAQFLSETKQLASNRPDDVITCREATIEQLMRELAFRAGPGVYGRGGSLTVIVHPEGEKSILKHWGNGHAMLIADGVFSWARSALFGPGLQHFAGRCHELLVELQGQAQQHVTGAIQPLKPRGKR